MKKIIIFIYMLQTIIICYSQVNLVPNPSFEQFDTCPNTAGQIEYAIPWTIPMQTNTPDYFNSCNTGYLNVPNNFAGYENARTGEAYAEVGTDIFHPINSSLNSHREYIQVELLSELEAGIKYCIKFYVSACDSANYISNDIGVYFSQNEIYDTVTPFESPLPYHPQFENSINLDSRDGWTEVSGDFTASGGEKYIVIGNFKDHNSTTSTFTGWAMVNAHFIAQYYIDDVSVYRCNSSLDSINIIKMPNIFTPNYDQLNDIFLPLEKHDISSGVLKIFNRWGQGIFSTNNIYNGWDGGNSPQGVYYWELKYTDLSDKNHRNNGYVVLIR